MEKRATTAVDSHQVTENQALLVPNPQQSVATVTQGMKDTVLENPSCSKKGTLICIPYLTRQVPKS